MTGRKRPADVFSICRPSPAIFAMRMVGSRAGQLLCAVVFLGAARFPDGSPTTYTGVFFFFAQNFPLFRIRTSSRQSAVLPAATRPGAGFVVIYDTVGRYTPPGRTAALPSRSLPRTDKNRPLPLKSAAGGDLYYRRSSKRTLPIRSGTFTQFRTVRDAGASGRGIRPVHPQSYLRGLLMAARPPGINCFPV